MNRRSFLRTLVGGVAAGAAVRTFPFRVFSFPSDPMITRWDILSGWAKCGDVLTLRKPPRFALQYPVDYLQSVEFTEADLRLSSKDFYKPVLVDREIVVGGFDWKFDAVLPVTFDDAPRPD